MEGRGGVAGWGVGGHLRKTAPNYWGLEASTGRGTLPFSGSKAHSSGMDLRRGGASMQEPLPGPPEGGLP